MADDGSTGESFEVGGQVYGPLRLPLWPAAEVAHAVNEVGIGIWGLFSDIGKAFFCKRAFKHPAAVVHCLLAVKPSLIVEIPSPDHVKACFAQKADRSLPLGGPVIGCIQRDLFHIERTQGFNHGIT